MHAVDFNLLVVKLLSKKWSLSVRGSVGLAGDYREIDDGLLRWTGMVMATYGFSDSLVLGGGILANYGFGSFLPLPALYFDWKPWSKIQFEGFIPAFINLKYLPHKRFEVGTRVEFDGNQYGVRDEALCGESCLSSVSFATGRVAGVVGVNVIHDFWIELLAGYNFWQRFDLFDQDNNSIPGNEDLPTGEFFRVNLAWRVPM